MNFIKDALAVLQLAMGLIPHIAELVKAFEMPGFGPEKLALVVNTVKEAFNLLPDELRTKIAGDRIEAFVTKVVGFLVIFFNLTGIFKKGAV